MNIKYQIHDQLTGMAINIDTWEEAKQIQTQMKAEWIERHEYIWRLTGLVEREDGAIVQGYVDENGQPTFPINPE